MIDKLDGLVRERLKKEYPNVCVTCGKSLDWFNPQNNPYGLQVGIYHPWQETLVENQLIGGVLLVFVSGKDDKEIEEKTERIKAFCNSMI